MPLTFRPLTATDGAVVHLLHGDPQTNLHNPYGASPDRATSERMLAGWLDHWSAFGFGYELVELDGECVGICGVRRDAWLGEPVLNLYWRILPEFQGRGLGMLAAQHALASGRDAPTSAPIVARMLAGNEASQAVARRLGLIRSPERDATVDGADWQVWVDDAQG
ncbi:MAG: GNAT family N-acetyltransferase [Rhodoglobus sp.]